MTGAEEYIEGVLSGRILVGEYVRAAVERHVNDLERSAQGAPFYFDAAEGQRVVEFYTFLSHYKGEMAGQAFVLEPWQQFILTSVFGWKNEDGSRRFRTVYIEVPRKNGKTTLAAGVSAYMLMADGEAGAECYTAATTRDQAKICFEDTKILIKKSPLLAKHAKVMTHNVHVVRTSSKLEAVSSDYDTLDGLNPHMVVLDEIHAYKNDGLYNIFVSAMGARRQPMLFMITTAGFNKNGFCYNYRKGLINLLKGVQTEDSTFGIIYSMDEEDDWTNPVNWAKANPNLGVSVFERYLATQAQKAKNNPEELVNFKTKNLNVWTDTSEGWIEDADWMLCAGDLDPEALRGRVCYGGLDLASVSDFCAFALLFPNDGGMSFDLVLWTWLPEEMAEKRRFKGLLNLWDWVEKGHVTLTEGKTTDYHAIKAKILDCAELYDLQFVAYDRWNSSYLIQELNDALGTTYVNGKWVERMNPMGQGFGSLSTPTKEFQKLVYDERLNHGGNPLLRWMLSNVMMRRDPAGNVKPDKQKSGDNIDGIMASIMAYGEYLTHNWEVEQSVYEDRGLRSL